MKKKSMFYTDGQGRTRYMGKNGAKQSPPTSRISDVETAPQRKALQFITNQEGQVIPIGAPSSGAGGASAGSGKQKTKITGGTPEQQAAVQMQVDHLRDLGFEVPEEIEVRRNLPSLGVTIDDKKIILQYVNPQALKYAVTHEIGHINQPADWTTWDLWEGTSVKIGGTNWKIEAGKVSEYAKTNPSEFWAELFAKQYTLS